MTIISNNLIGKMPIAQDAIVRINLAWVPNREEALRLLSGTHHDIYLDYPDGRNKPPRPTITLTEAINLAKHPRVKYFAISNADNPEKLKKLSDRLSKNVTLVPKIETIMGVKCIRGMIKVGIKVLMLDKEDLYTDVDCYSEEFNNLIEEARSYKDEVEMLELQGVVFS